MAKMPGGLRPLLAAPDLISQNQDEQYEANATNNEYDRSIQLPLAPYGEMRVMLADRATHNLPESALAVPYAEQDSQKGGAPGSTGGAPGGTDPETKTNFISGQQEDGTTVPGLLPQSPLKLSYGYADYSSSYPTFEAAHQKISQAPNPNAVQFNVGQWTAEGPMANTQYASPPPWAQGSFIG